LTSKSLIESVIDWLKLIFQ